MISEVLNQTKHQTELNSSLADDAHTVNLGQNTFTRLITRIATTNFFTSSFGYLQEQFYENNSV